eukprot:gnl/Carplike_NY0171/2215_a2984_646.p1 GENE.gnl/Carplike_NY0171/2215_a2984_646~~gnl/Carplike_NY0171/2215_a2984_646.p1  ORF type:complete len:412 (+),score=103.18 gnl/Carplike_NY0171/2215_a2984_646:172-1236(+)
MAIAMHISPPGEEVDATDIVIATQNLLSNLAQPSQILEGGIEYHDIVSSINKTPLKKFGDENPFSTHHSTYGQGMFEIKYKHTETTMPSDDIERKLAQLRATCKAIEKDEGRESTRKESEEKDESKEGTEAVPDAGILDFSDIPECHDEVVARISTHSVPVEGIDELFRCVAGIGKHIEQRLAQEDGRGRVSQFQSSQVHYAPRGPPGSAQMQRQPSPHHPMGMQPHHGMVSSGQMTPHGQQMAPHGGQMSPHGGQMGTHGKPMQQRIVQGTPQMTPQSMARQQVHPSSMQLTPQQQYMIQQQQKGMGRRSPRLQIKDQERLRTQPIQAQPTPQAATPSSRYSFRDKPPVSYSK